MKEKKTDTTASENASNTKDAACAIETTAPASLGSFEAYCKNHYTGMVADYLADRLNRKTLSVGRRSQKVPEPQRIALIEAKIASIRFHESDSITVYAEMAVDATIELASVYGCPDYSDSDTVKQRYKVDAAIVFLGKAEAEFRCFCAEIFECWGTFERSYALNEYLLPVLDKHQLDTVAEELLAKYYPEALISPEKMNGEELARRMGLTVIYACINKNGSELGRIYIDPCDITTYDSDGNAVTVHLDGGTIVLDPLAARKSSGGRMKLNIFHECVHYEYHPLFYRAQVLMGGSIDCLSNSTETLFPKDSPVGIAERQANQIAPRIAMPVKHAVRKANALADKYQERHPNWNTLRTMEKMIDELSEFYCVSRQCAKIRLIEIGYREAEGVFDYSNGAYVPSYQVSSGICTPANRTYTICFSDMLREYNENAAFRKVVDSGSFLYVESHLCLHSGRYIRRSKTKGMQLTTYAREHIDECCIAFTIRGYQAEYNYCPGMLKKGAPQAAKIISYPGRCEAEKKAEQEDIPAATARIFGVLKDLPSTFDETLKYHMDSRHITIENLEERSLVSASTIKRLRPKQNEDEEEPTVTLPTVVALCIGLNLEPMLSEDLVAKAGYSFRNTKTDTAYRLVLYHMYFYSIYQCNDALVASGVKPLTKAS